MCRSTIAHLRAGWYDDKSLSYFFVVYNSGSWISATDDLLLSRFKIVAEPFHRSQVHDQWMMYGFASFETRMSITAKPLPNCRLRLFLFAAMWWTSGSWLYPHHTGIQAKYCFFHRKTPVLFWLIQLRWNSPNVSIIDINKQRSPSGAVPVSVLNQNSFMCPGTRRKRYSLFLEEAWFKQTISSPFNIFQATERWTDSARLLPGSG